MVAVADNRKLGHRRKTGILSCSRGMTVIELMITLGVFFTVFSAAVTLVCTYRRSVSELYEQTAATEIASSVIEMIRALGRDEFQNRRKAGTLPELASMKHLGECSYSVSTAPSGQESGGTSWKGLHVSVVVKRRSFGRIVDTKLETFLRERQHE